MKTNHSSYLLFLFGLLLLVSCQNESRTVEQNLWDKLPVVAQKRLTPQGDSLVICDFSLLKDTIDIGLSYIASDIEIVCLSNDDNALITEGNMTISENYIGIYSSRAGEYKLFNKKGDFLTNISSKGQGPGEFTFSIYDSYIDERSEKVYLLPMMSNKVLVSDLNGEMRGEIPLPYTVSKAKMVVDSEKRELVIMVLPFSNITSVIWKQDFDGNIIQELSSKPYIIEHTDYSNEINSGLNTSNLDFSLFHWMPTADTLYNYSISQNKLNPVFTVKFPENNIPRHEYIELSDFYLVRIIDDEFNNYPIAMINKHTLTGVFVRFNIDVLAGIKGSPWIDFNRGYYVTNNYSYSIKDEIEAIMTSTSAIPDNMLERLELIDDNINDESNNIIILGKLKKTITQTEPALETNVSISIAQPKKENRSNHVSDKGGEKKEDLIEDDRLYGFDDLKEMKNTAYIEHWQEYFRANNKYKDWNEEDRRETIIKCIVEKDGTTSDVKIVTTSGVDSLDMEAVRLMEEITGVIPAINFNNQKIRSADFIVRVFFPPM